MPEEHRVKDNKDRKPVVVPPHLAVPYTPENQHRSKAEFIAARKIEKEKKIKLAEYAKTLDAENPTPEPKKAGRPKRIE